MAGQKQVCDIRAGKRMTVAQSNEHLRIGKSSAWKANIAGNLDETRSHLNFEIGRGGVVKDVDTTTSIPKRISAILSSHDIKEPNLNLTDEQLSKKRVGVRTHANIILEGSRETMRKLAFGDQKVNYEHGADNSHVTRSPEIEKWAQDMYSFMARKYGEENIAAFVVHLDETLPHVHCTIVPVTSEGKLSFRDIFAGKNRYEYSQRTKQLHDELAEVNRKWGLERGDSIAVTGAQHKSYLQWLKEQIAQGKKVIDEQNSTIESQAATIDQQVDILSSQKQLLYAINDEIRKAEKKQKGLSTMIENLEKQKEDLELELISLDELKDVTQQEIEEKRKEYEQKIAEIDSKIADKENKLSEAEGQLYDLAKRKVEIQQKLDELRREYNKEVKGDILDKTQREVDSTMWRIAAEEMVQDYSSIKEFGDRLPYDLRSQFNEIINGSFFEDLCERGLQIAGVAAALYLGMTDAAGNFARQSGGGGGSPGSGWGRDKDEDDEAFRRRCCIMGRMMMQPPGRKIKRS
jgi:predicted  nucleic acid-binding Zn-ribbon protein